jgi:hypothetical protein
VGLGGAGEDGAVEDGAAERGAAEGTAGVALADGVEESAGVCDGP